MTATRSWFVRRRPALLRRYDRYARDVLAAMEAEGLEAEEGRQGLKDARAHLAGFLEELEDPGTVDYRNFTFAGIQQIAIYRGLEPFGHGAASVRRWCEVALNRQIERTPGLVRRLMRHMMFSGFMRRRYQKLAAQSRDGALGGWKLSYEPGRAGEWDYGVTYERCAIHAFAETHDAGEFAPYICLSDIPGSDAFGWGLRRTTTLAQGGHHCDFRMRRNQITEVDVPSQWLTRRRLTR